MKLFQSNSLKSSNRVGSRSSSQKATTGRNTDRPSYINIKFSNYLNRSSCKLQNAIITVDYMLLDTTRERFIIQIKSYRIFQLPGSKLNISSIIVSLTQIYQIPRSKFQDSVTLYSFCRRLYVRKVESQKLTVNIQQITAVIITFFVWFLL